MIFGLEHQQATPPMNCVPDLWDSVVTFLFIFFQTFVPARQPSLGKRSAR